MILAVGRDSFRNQRLPELRIDRLLAGTTPGNRFHRGFVSHGTRGSRGQLVGTMDTDWWDLVPDFHRTARIPEPLLALDGRVFYSAIFIESFARFMMFMFFIYRIYLNHSFRLIFTR